MCSVLQTFHGLPADMLPYILPGSTALHILHFLLPFLLPMDSSLQNSSHSHGFLPHLVLPALRLHSAALTYSALQRFHALPADTLPYTHSGSRSRYILHFP